MTSFLISILMFLNSFLPVFENQPSIPFTHSKVSTHNVMIKKYTAYNLWANQQMAKWMQNVPDSIFQKEVESSFPSLKFTVEHIWNAEAGWLNHIKDMPWGEAPSKKEYSSPNQIINEWLKASENFDSYVQNMTEEQLLKNKANSSGDGFTSYIEMIHHCMNHSTYHRGQLITIGRQLGLLDPPRTDFIYYVRLK